MSRTLGLDIGIASVGWGLIEWTTDGGSVVGAGVWSFDAPETAKERTPKTALRRLYRGQRRVLRRRGQRMNAVRALFHEAGLLSDSGKDGLKIKGLDPWRLRAEGIDRQLAPAEFAVALGHIARHRGFRSNAKRDTASNAADETSKMKKAIAANQERLAQYRTLGEMLWKDPHFQERRRNRSNDYSRSILRADHEAEVRRLFERQRQLGNALATEDLEGRFAEFAFSQRPLQDSDERVGYCPFEPAERRTARRGYSFERFRLLSRLNAIRLTAGAGERPLSAEEIALVLNDFGKTKSISFRVLRKRLRLDDGTRFSGVPLENERQDCVARTGGAAEGTCALRQALGETPWQSLVKTPAVLDRIAEVLTFREDEKTIGEGLKETGIDSLIVGALMAALAAGQLKAFKGAGHISAKAARAITPHLAQGLVYSDACREAGYDHARSGVLSALDVGDVRGVEAIRTLLREENATKRLHTLIPNPVARKAVIETLKQVKAIVHEFGLPDAIHVELARDVGRNKEERDEISRGIERRNAEKDRRRTEFRELLGRDPNADDLLRYELWREQNGRCLYTDAEIHPLQIGAGDNSVQVDHILPWSRFGDDSFINKTLCTALANQQKLGRTPFEWFRDNRAPQDWEAFKVRVEVCRMMKGRKKRNYLLKDAAEREKSFRNRNLGDTRYAARVVTEILKLLYVEEKQGSEKGGERRVLARPGALTARLRQAWGIEALKKVNGERINDDRHHAVDGIVLAATSESMVNRLARAFQRAEREGQPQAFKGMEAPWPCFRDEVEAVRDGIFVARAERCRARGEAHAATIRQVRQRDGSDLVYERKAVGEKFTEKDLGRIKDPERNARYIAAIQAWLEAGKPKDAPPLSPRGDPIRKVRLCTDKKVDVEVRGGVAERGEMARVDVFRKQNKRGVWQYFLVPIYPHEIAVLHSPPSTPVPDGTPPLKWPIVAKDEEYLWPLFPLTYIKLVKSDGEAISGYFRSLDRSTGAISISPHQTLQEVRRSIGPRSVINFAKFRVDRLGRRFEVKREVRTWRGKACT